MPVLFANPLGFWALLGIPAVLLIHFLQRESRRLPVSTLFLLERIDRESVQGRTFDRLRQSLPLWLQLLGVLLLTWLLTEPRWTSARSVQRVVLVLDHSASMGAFQEELTAALRREIPPLTTLVGTTEYTLIESTLTGANLYRGTSFEDLIAALGDWTPAAGAHSAEEALRVGRSLAGAEGTLVFITDHPLTEVPFGAALLSVGSEVENVGFAGLRVLEEEGVATWRATLRNYAKSPQVRNWFLASDGRRTEARRIALAPGETRVLQGEFPDGGDKFQLVLEPDRFSRDDTLHVVRPVPKQLLVSRTGADHVEDLVAGLLTSLDHTAPSKDGETPDLVFATYNPLQPAPLPPVAVVFLNQEVVPKQFFNGPLVAANDPLVDDLNWQGLIARSTPSIPLAEGENVLLWQGERPLILLRDKGEREQLVFNFDVVSSNAPRLPAFVILVHRFLNRIRNAKVGLESLNTELRQPLRIAHDSTTAAPSLTLVTSQGRLTIAPDKTRYLRAPEEPGFFEVFQGNTPLLIASANFADTREADFTTATSFSEIGTLPAKITERRTVPDPAWQLWLMAFTAIALFCWHSQNRPTKSGWEKRRPERTEAEANVRRKIRWRVPPRRRGTEASHRGSSGERWHVPLRLTR
ncbi:MAG: hypothetical protein GXX91_05655 [Verrucomicrobiaceae bacterium]|nr:hypothetical protein [Verrucomicrobiaceae bacterium]